MNNKHAKLMITLLLCLVSSAGLAQLSNQGWEGQNQEKLEALMQQYGKHSPTYDPKHKPVAAFDWDNTMMKNDVGEATLLWLVAHHQVKRPASFAQMNPWLTKTALQELNKHCEGSGTYLPTDKPACADTLLNVYYDAPLVHGAKAWEKSPDENRVFPRYFFYAQLFAGYTPKELKQITHKALQFNLTNTVYPRYY